MSIEACLSVDPAPADALSVKGKVLGHPEDGQWESLELSSSVLLVELTSCDWGGGGGKMEEMGMCVRGGG